MLLVQIQYTYEASIVSRNNPFSHYPTSFVQEKVVFCMCTAYKAEKAL